MRTVSDIMHSIITIDKNETLRDAAIKMVKHSRGSVIITESEKTMGILTERDIMRFVAEGYKMETTRINGHFTLNIITADEHTSLEEAARIMEKNHIRRLPITRNDRIVGLITASKLAKNMRYSMAERFMSDAFHPGLASEMSGRNYR